MKLEVSTSAHWTLFFFLLLNASAILLVRRRRGSGGGAWTHFMVEQLDDLPIVLVWVQQLPLLLQCEESVAFKIEERLIWNEG